jgi:hypothetical protein
MPGVFRKSSISIFAYLSMSTEPIDPWPLLPRPLRYCGPEAISYLGLHFGMAAGIRLAAAPFTLGPAGQCTVSLTFLNRHFQVRRAHQAVEWKMPDRGSDCPTA